MDQAPDITPTVLRRTTMTQQESVPFWYEFSTVAEDSHLGQYPYYVYGPSGQDFLSRAVRAGLAESDPSNGATWLSYFRLTTSGQLSLSEREGP